MQHALQQVPVARVLDVQTDRFLAAIQPDEIGALPVRHMIVTAGEVALGALHLDHPRTRIRQAGTAIGRGDRLLQRYHQQPFQWQAHQKDLGKSSSWVATKDRIRLVDIGATWYRRVSRNLRSTSYSAVKP